MGVRWLRPIALWISGRMFDRCLRLLLRHGQVRHLDELEAQLRKHVPDAAEEFSDAMGDKARFVLERDGDAWKKVSDDSE